MNGHAKLSQREVEQVSPKWGFSGVSWPFKGPQGGVSGGGERSEHRRALVSGVVFQIVRKIGNMLPVLQ